MTIQKETKSGLHVEVTKAASLWLDVVIRSVPKHRSTFVVSFRCRFIQAVTIPLLSECV